ncbi:DUF6862 domain-containing protein [Undibacterium sp. SXout7W]|uniref:endonuclease toxin domain-containing protein n=1 Tax=Undibacterium sp. SXout7W TaxID=3413049 RepID=UPI003BF3091A
MQITSEFGKLASTAIGNYAQKQYEQALANTDKEGIEQWKEGGTYRVLLHTLVGALTGGTSGAAGAAASAATVPITADAIKKLNLPEGLQNSLILATSTLIGAVAGGNSGAAAATNETANNYLNHTMATLQQKLKDKQRNGQNLSKEEQTTLDNLNKLDIATTSALKSACETEGDACNAARRDLNAALNSYGGASGLYNSKLSVAGNAGVTDAKSDILKLANTPGLAQQTRLDAFKEFAGDQVIEYAAVAVLGGLLGAAKNAYTALKNGSGTSSLVSGETSAVGKSFGAVANDVGLGAKRGGAAGTTVVDQTATGIEWGKGIKGQGIPYEDYVASTLPPETRLPANFRTFDFFDKETGVATSVKTLDTTTAAKVANPSQVYSSLKGNVDAVANFTEAKLSGTELKAAQINARELNVAIPANTTPTQWTEINKAIQYGQSKGVIVKITVIK